MVALRTSPPAPSTIEFKMPCERRTFANVVTRFNAEASRVGAIGLNLKLTDWSRDERNVTEMNEPDFREKMSRQPWWENCTCVYDDITARTAIGTCFHTQTDIADDKHNRGHTRATFHVGPDSIMEASANGRMQDIWEVLNKDKLLPRVRKDRRISACTRQEVGKGILGIGYSRFHFRTRR
jgi:hypothetical protein